MRRELECYYIIEHASRERNRTAFTGTASSTADTAEQSKVGETAVTACIAGTARATSATAAGVDAVSRDIPTGGRNSNRAAVARRTAGSASTGPILLAARFWATTKDGKIGHRIRCPIFGLDGSAAISSNFAVSSFLLDWLPDGLRVGCGVVFLNRRTRDRYF
jgi:hypothetical protein